MSDILNNLMGLFGQDEVNTLSKQIGAEPNQTATALQSAVPTLLNALNNNASQGGASGILAALDRDHDGSILDDVMGFFQNGGNNDGNGILKHLLGDNKGNVENALAASSGLNASSISKLLPLIAPVIMGFLGKQKKENGIADEGGLSGLIGQLAGGQGGLDIGSLIGMFTGGDTTQQPGQANNTNKGGGILSIISKLFGK